MKKLNRNQRNLLEGEMSRYRGEMLQNQTYNFQKKIKELGDEASKVKENIYKNINELLAEPRSIKMEDGKRLTISHMQDVFDTMKPHKGKPWEEINKDPDGPANHFIMYAIAKGVKRENLAAYLENPKSDKVKDTAKQLDVLKDDFIKMVISEDQKQAEGVVVDYLKAVEKDASKLFGETKDVDGIKKNLYGLYVLGDPESLLKTDYPENSEFVKSVENKLKEDKANISLDSMRQGVSLLRDVAESIKKDDLKDEASLRKGNMGESTKFYSAFHAYDKFREGLEKENYSLTKASEDYAKIKDKVAQTQEKIGKATSMGWRKFDRKSLDRHQVRDNDEVDIAKGLLEEMKASKRTTFMGRIQKPSDEFVAVGKTLNRYINSHNDKLKMDRGNLNQLRADCEKYLEDHNPYSPQGRERYKLITKVLTYADEQLASMPDTAQRERREAFEKQNEERAKVGAEAEAKAEAKAEANVEWNKDSGFDKRMAMVDKTQAKFNSRLGRMEGDEKIEQFLESIKRTYDQVDYGKKMGQETLDDPKLYAKIKTALAKVEVYEMLRNELQRDTQNFSGPVSDQIRQGNLDSLVKGISRTEIVSKYLDENENNIDKFFGTKPSEFIKDVGDTFSRKQFTMEMAVEAGQAQEEKKESELDFLTPFKPKEEKAPESYEVSMF